MTSRASQTLSAETSTGISDTQRAARLREMVDMVFDATFLRLLEDGEIHLDTAAEQAMRDTIIMCVCSKIAGITPSTFCAALPLDSADVPARLEEEMAAMLRMFFAPAQPAPAVIAPQTSRLFARLGRMLHSLRWYFARKQTGFVAPGSECA